MSMQKFFLLGWTFILAVALNTQPYFTAAVIAASLLAVACGPIAWRVGYLLQIGDPESRVERLWA